VKANVQPTEVADGSLTTATFDDLLAQAVEFHGHLCPGQVLHGARPLEHIDT